MAHRDARRAPGPRPGVRRYLPRKLSTKGAPASSGGKAGAITYYAPWGNLALFYKDSDPASGLITLGTLDGGVEALRKPGPLQVRFERAE
ncbi:cyclophilin-like fold protein [Hyalangium rubrum]|uniref:Cyclophilin-like fold protein n=1 Tax=Hyalangium rubrum TaxID=3103134 RepID=A0ABU5H0P9_9BACT|nr:cyclophilin-like fold protein [Hyalangium sp. s54d21]MDY7227033.1 cyclophilin-like fold protein [Hyalangium sp. s54d21]